MIGFLYVWRATTIQLPKRFEFTGKLTSMGRFHRNRRALQHTPSGKARNWIGMQQQMGMVGGFCGRRQRPFPSERRFLLCTVFLGTKKCIYLLNVFCIFGVERRKNNPSRKEHEVAVEETKKGVSADYITKSLSVQQSKDFDR